MVITGIVSAPVFLALILLQSASVFGQKTVIPADENPSRAVRIPLEPVAVPASAETERTATEKKPLPAQNTTGTDPSDPATNAKAKAEDLVSKPQTDFRKNLVRDQKAIWSSPFRLTRRDLKWLIPFGLATAALIATDRSTTSLVSHTGTLQPFSQGVGHAAKSSVIIAFGTYFYGRHVKDKRLEETGVLAVEALINTAVVTGITKFITKRARPNIDGGKGVFFTHGYSFPSGHSAYTWTVATIVASEYNDRPMIKYGAYAIATVIAASRYSGRAHFLSEVVIGTAIGFGMGKFTFRKHHQNRVYDPAGEDVSTHFNPIPTFAPYFSARTANYGGSLKWTF